MARNILDLTSEEALDFFAQSEQYHSYELPEYIGFNHILEFVREKLETVSFQECIATDPCKEANLNMDLLINKDGRYGVRPLTLANPYLYWFLVKELCNPKGWKMTQECFQCYNVDNIESSAMPVVKDEDKQDEFHNAATILNWWQSFERRTVQLALDYRYMFITDITNCYGTIDPRTIEWAFNRKGTKHETDKYSDAASNVRRIVEALQNGRNIGIPQGSAIFNLLGEFVLGYVDLLFTEAVQRDIDEGKIKSSDYHVLRYRDDYRILCNDRDDLKQMSYILQHILDRLNLRLNTGKSKFSDSIVTDAIKPDKLYYIENTPVFNKSGADFDGLQKYMYFILMLGRKYPNSGTLNVLLSDLDKRVFERLKPHTITKKEAQHEPFDPLDSDTVEDEGVNIVEDTDEDLASGLQEFIEECKDEENFKNVEVVHTFSLEDLPTYKKEQVPGKILEDPMALASVGVQIAIENVQKVHYALRVVSRIVNSVKDVQLKWEIFDKVCSKLINRPNSDYDKIWLQNITYQRDKKNHNCPYSDVRLCQLVMGNDDVELWNNHWLKEEYTRDFPLDSICDRERLKKLTPVITFRETRELYEM